MAAEMVTAVTNFALALLTLFVSFPLPVYGVTELLYSIPEEVEVGHVIADIVVDARLASHYKPEVLQQRRRDDVSGGGFGGLRFVLLTPPVAPISVDETSGRVTTSGRVDREAICGDGPLPEVGSASASAAAAAAPCRVRLDVAIHPVQYFRMIKIVVEITDINDNDPEFRPARVVREMSEASPPGSGFVVPTARDADTPRYGVAGYQLIAVDDGDGGESGSGNPFALKISRKLDGSTEVRIVLTDTPLDREKKSVHHIRVMAFDGGDPPRSGHLDVTIKVLDANDNSPVFEYSAYEVTVRENIAVGTTVVRVSARDLDLGPNADVTYALGASTQAVYGDVFAVDELTGDVKVIGTVDHERASIYHLIVTAKDRGADPVPTEATVVVRVEDVNDNAPFVTVNTLTASGTDVASVPEDAQPGTFVGHVIVSDPDSGSSGRFNCSVFDDPRSEVDDDYEDDEADDDDVFPVAVAISGFGGSRASHFRLQHMFSAEYHLVTSAPLDRERRDVYRIQIRCVDGGPEALTSTKRLRVDVLDVNDNTPRFDRDVYTADVYENNYSGLTVVQVNATDDDIGENARLRYQLVFPASSSSSSSYAPLFAVDPVTGLITATESLDREQTAEHHIQVKVSDSGSPALTSLADVIVHVSDVNDEPPRFAAPSFRFEVAENRKAGTEVGTLVAVDADQPPFDQFNFRLATGGDQRASGADVFIVDPITGRVSTNRKLDREEQAVYQLTAVVFDPTVTSLSSTVPVTVRIADVNDNAPIFLFPVAGENDVMRVAMARATVGQTIGQVQARDADDGANGEIVYSIKPRSNDSTSTTHQELFMVDRRTGQISVAAAILDSFSDNVDELVFPHDVTATDLGTPPRRAIAPLNIVVDRRSRWFLPESTGQRVGGAVAGSGFVARNLVAVTSLIGALSAVVVIALIVAICLAAARGRRRRTRGPKDLNGGTSTVGPAGRYNCRQREEAAEEAAARCALIAGNNRPCPGGTMESDMVTGGTVAGTTLLGCAVEFRGTEMVNGLKRRTDTTADQCDGKDHSDYSSSESLSGTPPQRHLANGKNFSLRGNSTDYTPPVSALQEIRCTDILGVEPVSRASPVMQHKPLAAVRHELCSLQSVGDRSSSDSGRAGSFIDADPPPPPAPTPLADRYSTIASSRIVGGGGGSASGFRPLFQSTTGLPAPSYRGYDLQFSGRNGDFHRPPPYHSATLQFTGRSAPHAPTNCQMTSSSAFPPPSSVASSRPSLPSSSSHQNVSSFRSPASMAGEFQARPSPTGSGIGQSARIPESASMFVRPLPTGVGTSACVGTQPQQHVVAVRLLDGNIISR